MMCLQVEQAIVTTLNYSYYHCAAGPREPRGLPHYSFPTCDEAQCMHQEKCYREYLL
jgi:hypothetical protein